MTREGIFVIVIGDAYSPQWWMGLLLLYRLREAGTVADIDYRRYTGARCRNRLADN